MDILHAIVLGIVQGATEFLPISSSAHLTLTPWLFGWKDPGLSFDVALHWGTLVALLLYFWRDWKAMVVAWALGLARKGGDEQQARMAWFIIVATIPGVIAGQLLDKQAETVFRSPWLIAAVMGGFGIVMLFAERLGKRTTDMKGISFLTALGIGLAQAFAIVPGVSRAGVTMSTGLFLNLRRETAARFSFLLATPIIAGSAVKKGADLIQTGMPANERWVLLIGVICAIVVGYACIGLLLRFLRSRSFVPFVVYRLGLALGVFAVILLRLR